MTPNANVWIAGSGRSGTTWLATMVAETVRARVIFEPLHPDAWRGPELSLVAGARPFLHWTERAQPVRQYFDDLFSGRYANRWTRFGHNSRLRWPRILLSSLGATRCVLKAIRSNLMLPWVTRQTEYPVLLIVRHPCAVVASQLKRRWLGDIRPLLDSLSSIDGALHAHAGWLREASRDPIGLLAVRWALETLVPLRFAARDRLTVVHYESLAANPATEMQRVFTALGWPMNERMRKRLGRAIRQRVSGMGQRRSSSTAPAWQAELTAPDIERILGICRRLGATMYDERPRPQPYAWPAYAY